MEQHHLVFSEEDAALLDLCLNRFVEDTGVSVALLMGRDGHLLSKQGVEKSLPIDSLCALAVGAFASSEALARLVGEDSFNSIYHQGVRCNVYIALAGEAYLLLALFNYRASAPLVRLQAKVCAEAALTVINRAEMHAPPSRTEETFTLQ